MIETSIEYLADHPHHLGQLAEWYHHEWLAINPGGSIEKRLEYLRVTMNRGRIPTTFIALGEGGLLGGASLREEDMDSRPELGPWLANVYVRPEARGSGLGSLLVERVVEEARALGVRKLYLFTPDRQSFYARMGWKHRENVMYRGQMETVMEIELH